MSTPEDDDFISKALNAILEEEDVNEANSIADKFVDLVEGKNNATILCAVAFIISRISHSSKQINNEMLVYILIGGLLSGTKTVEKTIN